MKKQITVTVKRKQEVPLDQLCVGDEVRLSRGGEVVDIVDSQGFSTVQRYDNISPREIVRRRYSFENVSLGRSKVGRAVDRFYEGGKDYSQFNELIERSRWKK